MFRKIKKAYQSLWKLNILQSELETLILYKEREEYVKTWLPLVKNNQEYADYLNTIKSLLKVMDVEGYGFIRVGRDGDGGYAMLDDLKGGDTAYSFGISDDVSWDRYMADVIGADVYMYDHTIDHLPEENKKYHWSKTGVSATEVPEERLTTLQALVSTNGHLEKKNMILKMDVEGCEWDVLIGISEELLDSFDQIVMEMHDLQDYNLREKIIRALTNLNKTHQLCYVHANNYEPVLPLDDWNLPKALEVCYVNRKKYKFIPSKRFFPTKMDQPNNPVFKDIPLGFWNV